MYSQAIYKDYVEIGKGPNPKTLAIAYQNRQQENFFDEKQDYRMAIEDSVTRLTYPYYPIRDKIRYLKYIHDLMQKKQFGQSAYMLPDVDDIQKYNFQLGGQASSLTDYLDGKIPHSIYTPEDFKNVANKILNGALFYPSTKIDKSIMMSDKYLSGLSGQINQASDSMFEYKSMQYYSNSSDMEESKHDGRLPPYLRRDIFDLSGRSSEESKMYRSQHERSESTVMQQRIPANVISYSDIFAGQSDNQNDLALLSKDSTFLKDKI